MKFPDNYTIDNKIQSLSIRLNYMAKDNDLSRTYVNSEIKSENLKSNLSYILTQVILKLEFVQRGKAEFLTTINEYNSLNDTNLTYDNFDILNWISEVGDEIRIPERIRHYIWKMRYDEDKGISVSIPEKYRNIILCLEKFQQQFYNDKKLLIKKEELENILNQHAYKKVDLNALLKKEIIKKQANDLYSWVSYSEHVRHLSTEIAATLWQEIGGENATLDNFKQFYKLINGAELWPNSLINYIPQRSLNTFTKLAHDYLKTQKDLEKSPNEFRKIWLSAKDQYNQGIEVEIPSVKFDYTDQYRFMASFRNIEWQFQDIFGFQQSRNYCILLIKLIIENEPRTPKSHTLILEILQNLDMPFVVWNIYNQCPRDFPQIIPFLLRDTDLAPLAFQIIDKITLRENLAPNADDRDKKYELELQEINDLWIEMLDIVFESVEIVSYNDELAILFARILSDLAEKVFNTNGNSVTNTADHRIYRKRYDKVIRDIGIRRFTNAHRFARGINPRVILNLLPAMAQYIGSQISNNKSDRGVYVKLNSGSFDLGIELLRLMNMRTSESEISIEEIKTIKDSSDLLTNTLKDSLLNFYLIDEIETPTYDRKGVESKKVNRTADEFGFEIVDWGYLILHFERLNYLDAIHENVMSNINFFTSGDKYDDQNQQQAVKIKLFLKSLLLAFLTINEKRSQYEIDALPVTGTLKKLENWIRTYALQYSNNDIPNSVIDVFNDQYNSFGYNLYYKHMADLLYKSIPYFTAIDQEKFTTEYFAKNTDISRLLSAMNSIDSKKLQSIISTRISEIDIQDYIDERYMATDLEYALIEAVNSEHHWSLAEPLIKKLQEHFTRVGKVDINTENFLLEINLLLAFKQRNLKKLLKLEVPQMQYRVSAINTKGERLKRFFVALYKLYNEKNYDEAITLFNALHSEDSKNIRYAFHTYRAATLKAIAE